MANIAFTSKVRRLLEQPETIRLVSPVSFTEIAIKATKALTPFTRQHIEKLAFDLALTVLPLTAGHSLRLFGIPDQHSDKFDRMLIAIALPSDASLLARDRHSRITGRLRVIW